MYAPPNPKKLAYLKAQADALLAEAEKQRQIEQAYTEAKTGQERWMDSTHSVHCADLGICICDTAMRISKGMVAA